MRPRAVGLGAAVRRTIPRAPSRRAVKNALAGLDALANGTAPVFVEARAKRKGGKQPEGKVNEANQQWARIRNGVLYRNRRGMFPLPNGGMLPFGVGPPGSGDLIGYLRILITPEMVGRTLPIYTEIESKTDSGRLAEHQIKRIEELRDVQAIAGCARSADDCEEILKRWRDGYAY
jgi:hypothetical protein